MKAEIDMVDTMRYVTMYVKFRREREARWRWWLGMKLILLAAIIINCNVEIEGMAK